MPEPYYQSGAMTLFCGDNREVMPALNVAVSAVVTDPPYGLGFMGKAWDHGVPGVPFWQTIRDRMQPGAHLLAFGGTRTFHRMGVAIEDAGFEIKDTLSWLYGSGFPKHKSLLKPGWEPIILARKPGKGVLNIDACRIGLPEDKRAAGTRRYTPSQMAGKEPGDSGERLQLAPHDGLGRWPANVLLDEDTAAMLDAQGGERKSGGYPPAGGQRSHMATYGNPNERGDQRFTASTGGASRFFYVAKASRSERNAGLEGMPERACGTMEDDGYAWEGEIARGRNPRNAMRQNHHPTVKPLALMRWLLTLVTPPGDVILDPFAGSGSTLVAAAHLGIPAIGIEQSEEYCEIAARRIDHALAQARQLEMVAD